VWSRARARGMRLGKQCSERIVQNTNDLI